MQTEHEYNIMDNEDSPAIIGYHNHTNKGTVNCEKKIQIQELETWIKNILFIIKTRMSQWEENNPLMLIKRARSADPISGKGKLLFYFDNAHV